MAEKQRELWVWMNGERVGVWHRGRTGSHRFTYDEAWLSSPRVRPLSLSMPITPDRTVSGEFVVNYFDNLLPDDDRIRRRVAARFKTGSTETFELLQAIGRDCVGAVAAAACRNGTNWLRRHRVRTDERCSHRAASARCRWDSRFGRRPERRRLPHLHRRRAGENSPAETGWPVVQAAGRDADHPHHQVAIGTGRRAAPGPHTLCAERMALRSAFARAGTSVGEHGDGSIWRANGFGGGALRQGFCHSARRRSALDCAATAGGFLPSLGATFQCQVRKQRRAEHAAVRANHAGQPDPTGRPLQLPVHATGFLAAGCHGWSCQELLRVPVALVGAIA